MGRLAGAKSDWLFRGRLACGFSLSLDLDLDLGLDGECSFALDLSPCG